MYRRTVSTDHPKKSRDAAPGSAACLDCIWAMDCTRQRARGHVVDRGHTVRFTVTDVTVYSPLEDSR